MRYLKIAIIIGVLSYTGYSWYQYSLSPCDKVITYSIGRFDSKFGLSKEQFIKDIAEAEMPWEKAVGKNLFQYKADAKFTVNLIYDERQRETIAKQKTESGLDAAENTFRALDSQFELVKSSYESKKAAYDSAKASYEADLAAYEQEVSYWNAHGGASREKYNELQSTKDQLNSRAATLNAQVRSLNQLLENLNSVISSRNSAARAYNSAVDSYNKKFGGHLEFNQAEYVGNPTNGRAGEINVYQFTDSPSLITALSHELGHALSMDHVENPNSIMYYLRESDNTSLNPKPTSEDLTELKRVCHLK